MIGDLDARDVHVLPEKRVADDPRRVFVLDVAPRRRADVFVADPVDDLERLERHGGRLELVQVRHDLDGRRFDEAARQGDREPFADVHGVPVGFPPAGDRLDLDVAWRVRFWLNRRGACGPGRRRDGCGAGGRRRRRCTCPAAPRAERRDHHDHRDKTDSRSLSHE